MEAESNQRSCPICLEFFNDNDCKEILTTCAHSFCEACLQKALHVQPHCPICRHDQRMVHQFHTTGPNNNTSWNPQAVRAFFGPETRHSDGSIMRTVHFSDGEITNIHIERRVKIKIVSNELVLNGKRIQNPQECNQQ